MRLFGWRGLEPGTTQTRRGNPVDCQQVSHLSRLLCVRAAFPLPPLLPTVPTVTLGTLCLPGDDKHRRMLPCTPLPLFCPGSLAAVREHSNHLTLMVKVFRLNMKGKAINVGFMCLHACFLRHKLTVLVLTVFFPLQQMTEKYLVFTKWDVSLKRLDSIYCFYAFENSPGIHILTIILKFLSPGLIQSGQLVS